MIDPYNIPIEGLENPAENVSDAAREIISSILFVDSRLQQLQNEFLSSQIESNKSHRNNTYKSYSSNLIT